MAKPNDDLAAALRGLSSGEIIDDTGAEGDVSADFVDLSGAPRPAAPTPSPIESPARPTTPPPARAAARPVSAKPLEPAPAIPVARAAAAAQRTPPGQPRPPAPPVVEGPSAPSEAELQQAKERERQAAALAAPIVVADEPTIEEADEQVVITSLTPATTRPRSTAAPRPVARPTSSPDSSLNLRRTLIPILLTLSLLLPAWGAAKFVVDPDSPLAALPGWLTAALFAAGAVMLLLAIVNMMQVRRAISRRDDA